MQNEEKLHALNLIRISIVNASNAIAIEHLAYHWSNRMNLFITRIRGIFNLMEDMINDEMDKTEERK